MTGFLDLSRGADRDYRGEHASSAGTPLDADEAAAVDRLMGLGDEPEPEPDEEGAAVDAYLRASGIKSS